MTSSSLAVFDLDGTLVDTGPDLADACDHVLRENGWPGIELARLRPYISKGGRRILSGALEENGVVVPAAELDRLLEAYLDHYASRIARFSKPFPEMLRALDTLDARGMRAAICTNKREHFARLLLDALGLTERLCVIVGGDTFGVAKPDPLPLLKTIELAGAHPEMTVFVGDSRVDRETAQRANIPFVGVSYGYSDIAMADLKPDRLCDPGDDVGAAIMSLAQPAR